MPLWEGRVYVFDRLGVVCTIWWLQHDMTMASEEFGSSSYLEK